MVPVLNLYSIVEYTYVAYPYATTRQYYLTRCSHSSTSTTADFISRCTQRLLVLLARCQRKGTIWAEFPDAPAWPRPLHSHGQTPIGLSSAQPALGRFTRMPVGGQCTQSKRRLSSGYKASILAAGLSMRTYFGSPVSNPPTLRYLGGTAQIAELLAIHAGLHQQIRGSVYSDCLAQNRPPQKWTKSF